MLLKSILENYSPIYFSNSFISCVCVCVCIVCVCLHVCVFALVYVLKCGFPDGSMVQNLPANAGDMS